METVLIDEKELVQWAYEEISNKNEVLVKRLIETHEKTGVDRPFGGLTIAPCSKDMSIKQLIKNLLAIYNNNYSDSLFFQCDNIRMTQILRFVNGYLTDRGLKDDYLRYKKEHESIKQNHRVDRKMLQIT